MRCVCDARARLHERVAQLAIQLCDAMCTIDATSDLCAHLLVVHASRVLTCMNACLYACVRAYAVRTCRFRRSIVVAFKSDNNADFNTLVEAVETLARDMATVVTELRAELATTRSALAAARAERLAVSNELVTTQFALAAAHAARVAAINDAATASVRCLK